jgi:hypothetical protein
MHIQASRRTIRDAVATIALVAVLSGLVLIKALIAIHTANAL